MEDDGDAAAILAGLFKTAMPMRAPVKKAEEPEPAEDAKFVFEAEGEGPVEVNSVDNQSNAAPIPGLKISAPGFQGAVGLPPPSKTSGSGPPPKHRTRPPPPVPTMKRKRPETPPSKKQGKGKKAAAASSAVPKTKKARNKSPLKKGKGGAPAPPVKVEPVMKTEYKSDGSMSGSDIDDHDDLGVNDDSGDEFIPEGVKAMDEADIDIEADLSESSSDDEPDSSDEGDDPNDDLDENDLEPEPLPTIKKEKFADGKTGSGSSSKGKGKGKGRALDKAVNAQGKQRAALLSSSATEKRKSRDAKRAAKEAARGRSGPQGVGGGAGKAHDLVAELFGDYDFSYLELKDDAALRPIFVTPTGRVFLETWSPIYKQAYDFLIATSEPVSRPPLVHEYQLTPFSLYAAVSIGLETKEIVSMYRRLSKGELPDDVESFIRNCTMSYGKVKLVLQHNRLFLESPHTDVLQALLKDETIRQARRGEGALAAAQAPKAITLPGLSKEEADVEAEADDPSIQALLRGADDEDDAADAVDSLEAGLRSFEIDGDEVEQVKKRCIELDYPTLEEYDFRNDSMNPTLDIDLKPTTSIRPYQEKSLSKMFGNGRARSGIIVLPCGAGKTLVGITATSTIKKPTVVLCTSGVAVEQWKAQFKLWSTLDPRRVIRFTRGTKEPLPDEGAVVVISTYAMMGFGGRRSAKSDEVMASISRREWGLLVLDEVHVVPAHMFRKVLTVCKAHCKLGLTATLVREDNRIGDLNFLIGPKLYEANWLDLQAAGHIATVQCAEVWCSMTPEFYREYLRTNNAQRQRLLAVMNPNKFQAADMLIRHHEAQGDKVIVFADNVFGLKSYAVKLGKPFIYGGTPTEERLRILNKFLAGTEVNTIFISKVGDNSIDLPDASVIIQISSHFASRRQEAQRLGRILRPKARSDQHYNAFFYTLISRDTNEMYYSTKRQQFLVDQGYAFKIIPNLALFSSIGSNIYASRTDQLDLLAAVLALDENETLDEFLADEDDVSAAVARRRAANKASGASRHGGASLATLSGGGSLLYAEYSRGRKKGQDAQDDKARKHPLFRSWLSGKMF